MATEKARVHRLHTGNEKKPTTGRRWLSGISNWSEHRM